MYEVENKKQVSKTPAHSENKKICYKHRPNIRFTPRIKEIINILKDSFPKLFTRKPEPKYALKIGIYKDLLSWASEHNITGAELGKALAFWCYGSRYEQALNTGKRYDLNFNETPFYYHQQKKERMEQSTMTEVISDTTVISAFDIPSKRKKITYPENWAEVYSQWKNKEISFRIAMKLLNLKQSTFYKLAKEYTEKDK